MKSSENIFSWRKIPTFGSKLDKQGNERPERHKVNETHVHIGKQPLAFEGYSEMEVGDSQSFLAKLYYTSKASNRKRNALVATV